MREEVGIRLRQERERLRMSRGEFAEKTGIHRNTLARYESGEREPSAEYLGRTGALGVDWGFLITGQPSTAISLYSVAAARVLPSIAERAGINSDALLDLLGLASEEEEIIWGRSTSSPAIEIIDWSAMVSALFENGALLASIFKEVARVAHERGLVLACEKRGHAIMMLYRAAQPAGKVDSAMLEEIVLLASR